MDKVGKHTSAPVQNMGHLLHGSSRAFCSHVLKYGLRTINGSTGGWRVEASMTPARSAAATTLRERIGAARAETITQTKWITRLLELWKYEVDAIQYTIESRLCWRLELSAVARELGVAAVCGVVEEPMGGGCLAS